MTFQRTQDYGLIRKILTHPALYKHLADDGCPPATEFEPNRHPSIVYVLVLDTDEVLGLFMFVPQNMVCWEVHTCLLPHTWGSRAADAAARVSTWIWQQTDCKRIVTTVPAYNRAALRFARAAGMVQYGLNPKSYLKNGELHDSFLLGLSRPGNLEA